MSAPLRCAYMYAERRCSRNWQVMRWHEMNRHRTNINGVRAPERGEAASAEHTWSKSHTSATGPGAWSLTNEAWLWQVVGLRNGYQTALVMAGLTSKIHAKRLAQGTEVLLELRAGGAFQPSRALMTSRGQNSVPSLPGALCLVHRIL